MAAAGMQQSGQIIPTGLTELRRYAKQAEDMSKGIYSNEFMSTRYYNRFGAFSHYYNYCSVCTELVNA